MKKIILTIALTTLVFVACGTTQIDISKLPEPAEHFLRYTSVENGFTLEYQEEWVVKEDKQGRNFVTFTSIELLAQLLRAEIDGTLGDNVIIIDSQIQTFASTDELPNNSEGLSFEEWINTEENYFDEVLAVVEVDGEEGYLLTVTGMADIQTTFIMVKHNKRVYILNFNVPEADTFAEVGQHMLDTFSWL